jgi:hypothetical protein
MYFRAMTPDADRLPTVGETARKLGVRVPQDVTPDESGMVLPRSGGMSVAPDSMWNLPNHRRPRGLGRGSTGPAQDVVYSLVPASLDSRGLTARLDAVTPQLHVVIEPTNQMLLAAFRAALTDTRPDWRITWP